MIYMIIIKQEGMVSTRSTPASFPPLTVKRANIRHWTSKHHSLISQYDWNNMAGDEITNWKDFLNQENLSIRYPTCCCLSMTSCQQDWNEQRLPFEWNLDEYLSWKQKESNDLS